MSQRIRNMLPRLPLRVNTLSEGHVESIEGSGVGDASDSPRPTLELDPNAQDAPSRLLVAHSPSLTPGRSTISHSTALSPGPPPVPPSTPSGSTPSKTSTPLSPLLSLLARRQEESTKFKPYASSVAFKRRVLRWRDRKVHGVAGDADEERRRDSSHVSGRGEGAGDGEPIPPSLSSSSSLGISAEGRASLRARRDRESGELAGELGRRNAGQSTGRGRDGRKWDGERERESRSSRTTRMHGRRNGRNGVTTSPSLSRNGSLLVRNAEAVRRYDQDHDIHRNASGTRSPRATDLGVAMHGTGLGLGMLPGVTSTEATATADPYSVGGVVVDSDVQTAGEPPNELPPNYIERSPGLPTYDISARQTFHRLRVRSRSRTMSGTSVWETTSPTYTPIHSPIVPSRLAQSHTPSQSQAEDNATRLRQVTRVEEVIRRDRARPLSERRASRERRIMETQERLERLDFGDGDLSPIGAFRGSASSMGLDLEDSDVDVLLRAWGSPAT